jgi:transposase
MQPLSGNSSDKVTFERSVHTHIAHLQTGHGLTLVVSDSAGYSSASLKAYEQQGVHWIMSVPATLKEAKKHLRKANPAAMHDLTEGYLYTPIRSHYAGVEQRWLLIYSEQARARAEKSVDKELLKRSEQEYKAFEKLCRRGFNCADDAERALAVYQKTLKVLDVRDVEVIAHSHFASAGRPRKDAVPDTISYHVSGVLAAATHQREALHYATVMLYLGNQQSR